MHYAFSSVRFYIIRRFFQLRLEKDMLLCLPNLLYQVLHNLYYYEST